MTIAIVSTQKSANGAAAAGCERIHLRLPHFAQQPNARCHWPPPLSHALIHELHVTALGIAFVSHISLISARARFHCSPISHERPSLLPLLVLPACAKLSPAL